MQERDGLTVTTRIVVADDHVLARKAVCMLLDSEADFEIVAAVGDLDAAQRAIQAHRPDVLVFDLTTAGRSALRAIRQLRVDALSTKIVVVSVQDDPAIVREAIRTGALGYVLKEAAAEELAAAIRHTAGGGVYLSPQLDARVEIEPSPLFVCHANCCRSVLACRLYEHLCCGASALSAGLAPGEQTNDRALALLAWWGIDAVEHRPRQLDRRLCDQASAIFVMAPGYVRRVLQQYGAELASKAYLYADPFSRPESLGHGEYTVADPSFDERPIPALAEEFAWMRERALQIRDALLGHGPPLVAAASYLHLLDAVDPMAH